MRTAFEYNSSGQKLEKLKAEYQVILERLDGLEQQGVIGALIETSARKILNQGISQNQRETALRMLEDGELPFDKIAKYSGLKVEDVE